MASAPQHSARDCPKCGGALGVADIHTLAIGAARRAFYICPLCRFEWSQSWKSVDKGERISPDELLAVHEALSAWDGALTELLEVKPT